MNNKENETETELLKETEKQVDLGANEGDLSVKKRSVKLTEKAIMAKIETLQKERKSKLKNAVILKNMIVNLMGDKNFIKEVKSTFDKYTKLCDEAVANHQSLLKFLPPDEFEKNETWFKAKMLSVNEFITEVNKWLVHNKGCLQDEVAEDDELNKGPQASVDSQTLHTNVEPWTEEMNVEPQDSISNVKSNTSRRSKSYVSKSSKSTTSSVRRQAEAEQAALMARAAALEKKHALEEQVEQIRRKQEQLEIETQLAASAAKLAVLSSSPQSSVASKHSERSDGMASYFKLNPNSTLFVPKAKLEVPPKQQASVNTQAHLTNVNLNAQATPPQGNEALYSLLHKQNEITELLVQTQSFQFLPRREVPTFNGDPLQFRAFMSAFEQCVETKMQKGDCLYYLEQFTGGQPRELVRSCQHLPSDRAYDTAKDLLTKHFGNEIKITAAYVNKLTEWPTVKAEDKKGLQAYALCLAECCNAMQELRYLDELNMPANMKMIIQKLPYKLREKWRAKACDIFEINGRRAGFKDIVNFIEYQVKIVSDPTFGDIQDTPVIVKGGNKAQLQQRSQFKRNSFATSVFMSNEPAMSGNKKKHPDSNTKPKCVTSNLKLLLSVLYTWTHIGSVFSVKKEVSS